jgi:trehalose synthase
LNIQEVRVGVQPLTRFKNVIPKSRLDESLRVAREMQQALTKRVVWNVNSTAVGGGVAEMLQSLLGYTRSVGIDTRWVVISGSQDFFRITKRIHHALHGSAGDGSALGEQARVVYEQVMRENALELASLVRPGDVVILHDPQTAGLASALSAAGARLIWRCHIGLATSPTPRRRRAGVFSRPISNAFPTTSSRARATSRRSATTARPPSSSPASTPSRPRTRSSTRRRCAPSSCTRVWSRAPRPATRTTASSATTARPAVWSAEPT